MTARRFFLTLSRVPGIVAFLPLVWLVLPVAPARGDDATPDSALENAKFHFIGRVNSPSAFVRAGPTDNDYPVLKLDDGAQVTVVGEHFGWLKIAPPEGSFGYVAKAYVEKHGDGSEGRVVNSVMVRIGSTLNAMKAVVATRLQPGSEVNIIGEADEYFKIKLPEGTCLYIKKEFVEPVQAISPAQPTAPPAETNGPSAQMTGSGKAATDQSPAAPSDNTSMGTGPTTNPAEMATRSGDQGSAPPSAIAEVPTTGPASMAMGGPTTQPTQQSVADAEATFDRLEQEYADDYGKPLDQQNPAALLSGYQKVVADRLLSESLLRSADGKVAALKQRIEDRGRYAEVMKQQEAAKQRLAALQAEKTELQERIAKTEVKWYTAVGTLRASSLQQGAVPLYRLTDPSSGRTVVYLRSDDAKLGSMMGQFLGVTGDVVDDPQLSLKVITPKSYEVADQSKVFSGVMAQLMPPSMVPSGEASTGNQ
jgi:SH3-like domain-containing protein